MGQARNERTVGNRVDESNANQEETCRGCGHCEPRHMKPGINTSGEYVCMVLGALVPDAYLDTAMCSGLYHDARSETPAKEERMFYTYEATLTNEQEGGYTVAVPSFECVVAGGDTIKEACENAAGCLQLTIADMLDNDEPLPGPIFSEVPQLVLCVEVSDSFIKESACMTLTEAAEELGVTPSRVAQLLDAGLLTAAHPAGKRMVTIESVNERKKEPPRRGRPRKNG